mmetsp:Transcript_58440/g.183245  ORF Transcript_58440/g.183245 Transcript_58440/m.183245 type:complete len:257 (+) Transcript_58440:127-897(+)
MQPELPPLHADRPHRGVALQLLMAVGAAVKQPEPQRPLQDMWSATARVQGRRRARQALGGAAGNLPQEADDVRGVDVLVVLAPHDLPNCGTVGGCNVLQVELPVLGVVADRSECGEAEQRVHDQQHPRDVVIHEEALQRRQGTRDVARGAPRAQEESHGGGPAELRLLQLLARGRPVGRARGATQGVGQGAQVRRKARGASACAEHGPPKLRAHGRVPGLGLDAPAVVRTPEGRAVDARKRGPKGVLQAGETGERC